MMRDRENHEKRLDELVAESIEILEHQNLLRKGVKSREIQIQTPWFSYGGSVDDLLDRSAETKAAIVYAAAQYFHTKENSLSRIGEALHHARELQKGLSDRAYFVLKGVRHNIYELGYRSIPIPDIIKEKIGDTSLSRRIALRERLEAKARTLPNVMTFYSEFIYPGLYAHESIEAAITTQLRQLTNDIVPESLERQGFRRLNIYLDEQAREENGKGLLKAWIEESLKSEEIVVEKGTIDGVIEYIPPEFVKTADEAANRVKKEHTPRYIERNGYKRLDVLVREGLSPEQQKNAGKIEEAVKNSDLKSCLQKKDTTEGSILYVSPEGVAKVEIFIAEATAPKPSALSQLIKSLRIPFFRAEPQNVEKEQSALSPLYDVHRQANYEEVLRLVRSGQYKDEGMEPRILAASSSIRLAMRNPLSRNNQNKVWQAFVHASLGYQKLYAEIPPDMPNIIVLIREDISSMEDFISGARIDPKYSSRFRKEISDFKATYSGLLT